MFKTNLDLYQASTYKLIQPVTMNGQAVNTIVDAKMTIRSGTTVVAELLFGTDITYENGNLVIRLPSSITQDLSGNFSYELWFVDAYNNPYIVNKDKISFNSTETRFT